MTANVLQVPTFHADLASFGKDSRAVRDAMQVAAFQDQLSVRTLRNPRNLLKMSAHLNSCLCKWVE